jgi:hypothetical protein
MLGRGDSESRKRGAKPPIEVSETRVRTRAAPWAPAPSVTPRARRFGRGFSPLALSAQRSDFECDPIPLMAAVELSAIQSHMPCWRGL